VVDGKKGQEYQFISQPVPGFLSGLTFSKDSSRFAYIGNAVGGKSFLVLDDDESDAYDGTPNFRFLPDGKRVIVTGRRGQDYPVTIDGKPLKLPGRGGLNLDSFTMSPDGSHYAFFSGGNVNDGGAVFLDGKETGLAGTFLFSPDSKHLAVVGYRIADSKRGLFVDGTLIYPAVQTIGYRAFSPDSQHLFWMSLEPVTTPNPTDAFEWVTYADGKPVAHNDRSAATQALLFPHGFAQYTKTPAGWNVRADGALHMLLPADEGTRHLKATPSADTSVAMLIEAANKPPEKKSAGGK
jgi:hypothetical protein